MNIHDLDALEKASIRAFVQQAADDGLLSGRVLDYGCGKQPYRSIVEQSGGDYMPWDRWDYGGNVSGKNIGNWVAVKNIETVLTTQVIQYVPNPAGWLQEIRSFAPEATLVMTYPTAWPVIRDELWHFTKHGMSWLLTDAGYVVSRHELRLALPFEGFEIPVGYGVIAK